MGGACHTCVSAPAGCGNDAREQVARRAKESMKARRTVGRLAGDAV